VEMLTDSSRHKDGTSVLSGVSDTRCQTSF